MAVGCNLGFCVYYSKATMSDDDNVMMMMLIEFVEAFMIVVGTVMPQVCILLIRNPSPSIVLHAFHCLPNPINWFS